jgi:ATP-dependent DNA helicase DinG
MGRQSQIRVALDIETTGLHAEQDAILEVAAIKFRDETILDTMETLVAPGRPIPYRVQRLTGITPQSIANAPPFESIAEQLRQFIDEYPIVGHSIPFDASFLRRRGLMRTNPLIDTFELATVLLPSLPSYGLDQVALALGIPVAPGRHRAMVDTILAMQVFLALHRLLRRVDTSILKDLAHLDAPRSWPLLGFFKHEWRERMEEDGLHQGSLRGSLGDHMAEQLGMDPRVLSFAIARQASTSLNEAPASVETAPALMSSSSASIDSDQAPVVDPLQTVVEVMPGEIQGVQETQEAVEERFVTDQVALTGITGAAAMSTGDQSVPRHSGYQTAYSAIWQALDKLTPLLLEVTVGANDYTPALLPALEWVSRAAQGDLGEQICLVIAVANAQGARRLYDTTLPRLQAMLKIELPTAYLAERDGYLCLHRWFSPALQHTGGELTGEQARGIAKLAIWAQQTLTGERSELTLLPYEVTAWERIASGDEHDALLDEQDETPYAHCPYRKHGYCFSARAEDRVRRAKVLVTSHAGLLDDLTSPRSLLKQVRHFLILDADMLEDECARWSSNEFSAARLHELLRAIGDELPDGRYQGLLALAAPTLSEYGTGGLATTSLVDRSMLDTRLLSWFQTIRQAHVAIDTLFNALGQLLQEGINGGGARDKNRPENAARGTGGRGAERVDQPLRLSAHMRNLASWMAVEHAWQQALQRLKAVIALTGEAQRLLLAARRKQRRPDLGSSDAQSVAWELALLSRRLLEQKRLAYRAFAIGAAPAPEGEEGEAGTASASSMVYWLRVPPSLPQTRSSEVATSTNSQPGESLPVLHAQLAQPASLIKRHLLQPGISTILAGVALSVDHHFSYYRGRYGLDVDASSALSVVTEFHEQTLLYLPDDVPEPNAPQYQRHLDEAIINLATALDGQLVVLFTSYAALRSSYATVKPQLEQRGILTLGHGIDGSPRQLWHMFQRQERVVLLGTGSFWDGTEEISRSPACILVSRLPMPVLNDPPIAAMAEHYSDQLHQVTIPLASLRIRRALNRLAWSGSERNAVVLFDRRVLSKEYGATVLHTLPRCSLKQGAVSHMPEIILDWLTSTGSLD